MSDTELNENKLTGMISNIMKRLRPRFMSEWAMEKAIVEKATELTNEVRKELIHDFNLYKDVEDADFSEDIQEEPFYKLISEEEDDAYSKINEIKVNHVDEDKDKHTDKKGLTLKQKIYEVAGTFLINRGVVSVSGLLIERRQPREIREQVQAAMYIKSFEDPIVSAIVENRRRFIQGRGIKFSIQVSEIQEVLDKFWVDNRMSVKEKIMMHNGIAESEVFLTYHIDGKEGNVKLRQNSPGEITEIETDPEDSETILTYTREFFTNADNDDVQLTTDVELKKKIYADVDYFVQKKGPFAVTSKHDDGTVTNKPKDDDVFQGPFRLMQFEKLGKNREVRSRVELQSILKWTKIYTNWLKDRAVLNHERARVVWILTVQGKLEETFKRHKIAPSSGTVRIESENRKWRAENASINAHEAKDDGRSLMHQIATGAGMPISIWANIVDDGVYASIKSSETPFSQLIVDEQDRWESVYLKMFQVVIRAAVQYGDLSKKKFKIKKFLQEFQKKVYLIQKDRFDKKEIDAIEMMRTIKEIIKDFLSDVVYDKAPKSILNAVLEVHDKIMKSINENIEEAYDNKDFPIKKALKDFVMIYEKGVEIEVKAEDVPINIIFPEIVKEDPLSQSKTLLILQRIGVSRTTLLRVAGYDPEREAAFRDIEKADGIFDDLIDELNPNNDRFNNNGKPPDFKKNPGAGGADGDSSNQNKPKADKE